MRSAKLPPAGQGIVLSSLLPQESALATNPKTATADAQFKKAQRDQDGKKAAAEYEARGAATRIKTEKLRALRLARDAELAAAAAANPAPVKAAKKPAKPKPTLSAFHRDSEGSRNR